MYQPMSQQFHGPAMDSATALFVPKSWRENIRARGQLLLLNRMPRTVSAVAIGITIPAVSLPSDANPWPPYVSGFQSQGVKRRILTYPNCWKLQAKVAFRRG
jgi:hypothetical protein